MEELKGNYYKYRKQLYDEVFTLIGRGKTRGEINKKLKFLGCTNKLSKEIINDIMGEE